MLLGLALGNFFEKFEGSLVGFSLGTLGDLMVSTVEGYLVGLFLVLLLGHPLGTPNHGAIIGSLFGYLTGIIFGMYLGNPL